MLYSIVLFIFVVICLLLVGIILLQTSQTGGMGSIGGGNSYLEGALGGQGADSLLLRTTTIFAVIFMSLAIFLNYLDNPKSSSNITVESSIEYSSDAEESNLPNLNLENPISEGSDTKDKKETPKALDVKKVPLNTSGE
ncbi:MAG: preprotein translocase subunit SecG [bacterium TMED161]|nr:preprotein translocase subunit SecG [Candidatus Neomarinimicrobiota bacterium]OUW21444.1 MAG: preprotein translocase subunit SecG [bacterium TMED161]|tara:strand:- start:16870 stop:17286 length:417 start_codon:yes stop_codon:yes gene_type:complete